MDNADTRWAPLQQWDLVLQYLKGFKIGTATNEIEGMEITNRVKLRFIVQCIAEIYLKDCLETPMKSCVTALLPTLIFIAILTMVLHRFHFRLGIEIQGGEPSCTSDRGTIPQVSK